MLAVSQRSVANRDRRNGSVPKYRPTASIGLGSATISSYTEHVTAALDPGKLASAACTPVDASTPPLPADEVRRLAPGLDPAWQVQPDRLVRDLRFGTFSGAFGLATRIALLAEQQGHHPTMEIAWGHLVVTWQTDAIGAITANDLIMAAKVDRIVDRGLGIKEP
jgi:4a-hydroxytetrahydrobiopterin dehydratase